MTIVPSLIIAISGGTSGLNEKNTPVSKQSMEELYANNLPCVGSIEEEHEMLILLRKSSNSDVEQPADVEHTHTLAQICASTEKINAF